MTNQCIDILRFYNVYRCRIYDQCYFETLRHDQDKIKTTAMGIKKLFSPWIVNVSYMTPLPPLPSFSKSRIEVERISINLISINLISEHWPCYGPLHPWWWSWLAPHWGPASPPGELTGLSDCSPPEVNIIRSTLNTTSALGVPGGPAGRRLRRSTKIN